MEFVNLVSRPAVWQGGCSGHIMVVVGIVHIFLCNLYGGMSS